MSNFSSERIVALASGRGTLIEFIKSFCALYKKYMRFIAVGSDRYSPILLKRVAELNIPSFVVEYRKHPYSEWNTLLADTIKLYRPTILLFLGFMRIVSSDFITEVSDMCDIVNIHPSILPKYKGAKAIERAFAAGEKEVGSTLHRVTADVDSGEIIDQITIGTESQSEEYLRKKLYDVEKELLYRYLIRKIP